MAVLTIVQRAIPFPWKRRSSATSTTSKGKEKEEELDFELNLDHDSDLYFHEKSPGTQFAAIPRPSMHSDVSDTLHVAVKQSPGPDQTIDPHASSSEFSDCDSDSESEIDQQEASSSSSRARFGRMVNWASIVRSRCRWTQEQEKELQGAEKQLARCQRAWSSEQELWLSYIQVLREEKEAHEGFMLMRLKQQEDERSQFRKVWKRRRSIESALEEKEKEKEKEKEREKEKQITLMVKGNINGLQKLRRLQLGYLSPTSLVTKSPAVTCQA
ncbi:hypothetical protein N7466_008739 [Penicillium verhagenii]|uniref:uncharacterized protein n=1 Tax=Penicillium verhagenii TaxID=1562060 RepID=UPI0025450AB1|nr:uncharacterized protein N7466_008739 [Penicillium verhagenii]KAJ5924552.1 hypothetical protein N7466_008739 [Penicillium verhagenii]